MNTQSGYKKQQNLSFIQLLSEVPAFIVTLISAILANTILLFVDLMDSFGTLLRSATAKGIEH
jgi:choline-glycine betaine transporter